MANVLVEKNGKKIFWRKLRPEDQDEVDRLMIEEFSKNEPICQAIVATEQEILDMVVPLARSIRPLNISIGAYEEGRPENKLCGILLLSSSQQAPSHGENDCITVMEDKTVQSPRIQLLRFIGNFMKGVEKYIGNSKYMCVEIASVERAYCGMGIMTKLCKIAEMVAVEQQCRYMVSEFTSKFTQMIGDKLGYETLKELKYDDYVDDVTGKKPFTKIDEVHTSAKLMCLDLNSR